MGTSRCLGTTEVVSRYATPKEANKMKDLSYLPNFWLAGQQRFTQYKISSTLTSIHVQAISRRAAAITDPTREACLQFLFETSTAGLSLPMKCNEGVCHAMITTICRQIDDQSHCQGPSPYLIPPYNLEHLSISINEILPFIMFKLAIIIYGT